MTVKELKEMLNELGDHMPIQMVDTAGDVFDIKDKIVLRYGVFMIEPVPQDDEEEDE